MFQISRCKRLTIVANVTLSALALSAALTSQAIAGGQTITAVMHSDLRIIDPGFTPAYITRDHGYMVYDTLLATDANFKIQPQMADWKVSDDKLTYTFTLRDGLKWHDGTPVAAEDCVASLKRWGKNDGMGQKLMDFTASIEATDAKTITLKLKEPYGLVLESIAKPSSYVPFMMPKRLAETPPEQQIKEQIGSGPFKFVQAEFQPGVKAVYEKNKDYVPRKEAPSWTSGGKIVKDVLDALVGDPKYYDICGAIFICGTPMATEEGSEPLVKGNGMAEARTLLSKSGYNGTPLVLLAASDVTTLKAQPIVAAQLLRKAGFKVDVQTSDWQTLATRRAVQKPPREGGWSMFFTNLAAVDLMNPIGSNPIIGKGRNGSWFGWPDDPKLEALRDAFAQSSSPEEQKRIAGDIQKEVLDQVIYIPLGQYRSTVAWRKTISGVLEGPVPTLFWNMDKSE